MLCLACTNAALTSAFDSVLPDMLLLPAIRGSAPAFKLFFPRSMQIHGSNRVSWEHPWAFPRDDVMQLLHVHGIC